MFIGQISVLNIKICLHRFEVCKIKRNLIYLCDASSTSNKFIWIFICGGRLQNMLVYASKCQHDH